jgi:hypothetical protein
MNFKRYSKMSMLIFIVFFAMLAACSSTPEAQENANTDGQEAMGALAMVDSVTVELKDNHDYAVIYGNYPDPCSRISSVEQVVDGNTISITLLTKSPEGVMCAMMLTPYTVNILLTTGGLLPGEFTVTVNQGPSTTFTLE